MHVPTFLHRAMVVTYTCLLTIQAEAPPCVPWSVRGTFDPAEGKEGRQAKTRRFHAYPNGDYRRYLPKVVVSN